MTTITVLTPAPVAVPRAARWAAHFFLQLLGAFESRRRGRVEREAHAQRVKEAAAVRAYAQRFMGHDPRYAADLFAAADRHEQQAF